MLGGFTGGKNEIICGVEGREFDGICTNEESAAEDDEDERAERVRWRVALVESFRMGGIGSVATERADDTEGRRWKDGVHNSGDTEVDLGLEEGAGIAETACGGEEEI